MQRATTAFSQAPGAPVSIESRALGTLAYIRASIEASSAIVVPGMAAIVMGVIGTAAAALTLRWPGRWFETWVLAGVAAFLLGGAIVVRQASERGAVRYLGPVKKFLLCLCPVLFAAAVLTCVLWQAGMDRFLPGMWLLLYGCAVLSASTVMSARITRLVVSMGLTFVLLGAATYALPLRLQAHALGLGFGALQLVHGLLIRRVNRGD